MMISALSNQNNYNMPRIKANGYKTKPLDCDSVSFTGHAGYEKCAKKGMQYLKHETAFFREPETDNFVIDYIHKNFAKKDKIKIISGGCSTGEEAVTYSMLLDNMKDKVDILGFDLSRTSIDEARSRKYLMQHPTKECETFATERCISAYKDSYLTAENTSGLSAKQQNNRKLFDKFFEPTDDVYKDKTPLMDRFQLWFSDHICRIPMIKLESKYYKLKDGMADNCKFVQGDIENIEQITGDKKADVILFRNALYHLATDENGGCRYPKVNSEGIIENVAKKIKNSLNDNGILVFGVDEPAQLMDDKTVPKVMTKLGFKPLNKTSEHPANVWEKI